VPEAAPGDTDCCLKLAFGIVVFVPGDTGYSQGTVMIQTAVIVPEVGLGDRGYSQDRLVPEVVLEGTLLVAAEAATVEHG